MSYSVEQTEAYDSMMCVFTIFEEMKKSLSKNKCPLHNNRLKMEAFWEKKYDVDVLISKYCCISFAEQVAKQFIDTNRFTSVKITI